MDVGDLVGGRTPEGAGIDPDREFVRWLKVLVGRGTPEGEDIGSGKDFVVGIQLGFREMAKSIAAGPELAVGSNS